MIKCEIYERIGIHIVQKREIVPWLKTFQGGFLKEGVIEQALEKQEIRKRGKEWRECFTSVKE